MLENVNCNTRASLRYVYRCGRIPGKVEVEKLYLFLIFHSPQLIKGDVTSVECVLDHRNFYINFSCATLYIYTCRFIYAHVQK